MKSLLNLSLLCSVGELGDGGGRQQDSVQVNTAPIPP